MTNNRDNESPKSAPVKKKGCGCLLLKALGVLFVLLVVAIVAAVIYPAPILRIAFARVEAKTGIAITFDKAHFILGDRGLVFNGLAAKRENHHTGNFDVKAQTIAIGYTLSPPSVTLISLSNLRGTYERVGSDKTEKRVVGDGAVKTDNREHKTASESLSVKALVVTNVQIDFTDRTLEKPFRTTIQIEQFYAFDADRPWLFEPFVCKGIGQISSADFDIRLTEQPARQQIELSQVPLGLFAPYTPVLDDIFVRGSMNILMDDLSDESQKKIRAAITLLPDCEIKPANEILAPAIQMALQQLDQSSVPALHDLKRKIERLKTDSASIRAELDRVVKIIDTLKALAPRDVREKYEQIRSRYDRIVEWDAKFETLLRELDQVKVSIVNDTFRHFAQSGIPIEVELQQVDGEWQYDGYAVVVALVEKNYQTLIDTQYRQRIQELRDAVDRLLAL